MKKYLIWGVAGLLGLIVVIGAPLGVTLYMMNQFKDTMSVAANQEVKAPPVKVTKDNVVALKPFIANLADADKPKYVSLTVELVLKDAKKKEDVETNTPLVRDTIVSLIASKKAQEVSGEAGANTLKTEMVARLNTALGGQVIDRVLITDLVVQY